MEKRNKEESRSERMLRDLLMERYETAGPTERMVPVSYTHLFASE